MIPGALTVALAVLAQGAAPIRSEGKVLQATAARAYLDAGADEGLALGEELVLRRGHAEELRCRVDAVSARAASCAVAGARAGDRFALPAPPARRAEEVVRLAPPPPGGVLEAQRATLTAVPVALVPFTPSVRAPVRSAAPIVRVEVSEAAWLATGASAFNATRASMSINGADVGLGLRLDVDAQAIRWWSRPNPRFRPRDDSQLYVWQLGLTRVEGSDGATVSFGRIMPWRIPGATIIDGATAGWRFARVEVGAFGGLVPQPSTLAPTSDRATAGGYWAWDQPIAKGVSFRDEGRVAFVRSPELGSRLEAETLAAARLGRALDLSGSVRLGFGGDVQASNQVDAARLQVATRPIAPLRVAAWVAYDGLEVPKDVEPMVYAGHNRRAEGSVTWTEGREFSLTVLGGTSKDLGSGLDRSWVGPMLDLPRILFGWGGVSLGYLEEMGWTDGRSAWIQAVARPWARLRLLTRVSWSHATALALYQDEFGVTLGALADLTRSLSARVTVTGRGSFMIGGGQSQGGGTALATLVGRY
jgi:hypothetical protein